MFVSRLVRDRRMINVVAASALSSMLLLTRSSSIAHADVVATSFATYKGVEVAPIEVDPEEAMWEYKRNSCSFCRTFLESPCQAPFKTWALCSDNAKANGQDPNTVCSQYSEALLACSTIHDDYFKAKANADTLARKQDIEMRRRKYRISLGEAPLTMA